MSQQPDHLNQIIQTLVFMGMFMKQTDSDTAKAFLGGAVIACQRDGEMGDDIPQLIFQKVFPGEELPTVVSSDIFETIQRRQQDQSKGE
ncbi:hypothetical protein [Halomonas sp. GT]|uniref:hypothetical protein n=1 Tax=Halomonas sp. GT TaxID=1971364 RepID=UPI0009F53FAB|nr:hypothetical protein [Halomonas sp. GT]